MKKKIILYLVFYSQQKSKINIKLSLKEIIIFEFTSHHIIKAC